MNTMQNDPSFTAEYDVNDINSIIISNTSYSSSSTITSADAFNCSMGFITSTIVQTGVSNNCPKCTTVTLHYT